MLAAALSLVPSAATPDAERPSWKAGHSVCHSFAGFQPTDLFPIRSPLAVLTRASTVLSIRATRTSLLHAVRTRGAGQLAPRRHALYVRSTCTSLGRAVRTMYRCTTGRSSSPISSGRSWRHAPVQTPPRLAAWLAVVPRVLTLAVRCCLRAALALATHRAPGRRRRWLSAAAVAVSFPSSGGTIVLRDRHA